MTQDNIRIDITGNLPGPNDPRLAIASSKATFNFVNIVRQHALDTIIRKDLVFKNQLTKSLATDARSISAIPQGHVLTAGVKYGIAVEFGSKAHSALMPRSVIEDNNTGLTAWVRIKLKPKLPVRTVSVRTGQGIGGIRSGSGSFKLATKRRRIANDENSRLAFYRSVAYAIAMKKTRVPTKEQPFIRPAINLSGGPQRLVNEYADALRTVLSK